MPIYKPGFKLWIGTHEIRNIQSAGGNIQRTLMLEIGCRGLLPGGRALRPQIYNIRLRNPLRNDDAREIDPLPAPVQDNTIGSGNNLVRASQEMVRTEGEFDVHAPTGVAGNFENESFEASAIGDGLIEQPAAAADAQGRCGIAHDSQRRESFIDPPISPMHPGDVPVTAIASRQHDGPGQRTFQDGQNIVTVKPQLLSAQISRFPSRLRPALNIGC